jgi:glycosyltransferase involved in cell wall biosynthesis
MHVLLATGIYPPETGGPATFVPALAAEWTARGHQVTVVTYGDERTKRSSDWSVEVVSRAGGVALRYLRYASRVWRLARSADVVFLQGAFSEGLPGTIGAILAGKKTLLRVPGDFAWEGMQREQASAVTALETFLTTPKPVKWRIVFAIESWVARRASFVVTPSRYLQQLSTAWGVQTERQRVIYNTVELEQGLPPRAELRERFGLRENQVVLLSNARGASWKRVDFLLEVLQQLPESYRLVHIGEGPEIAVWKRKVTELGLTERVQFNGRVSYLEVQSWARAADAFVLPSLYEGFPHVAIEAACHGAPCFLSDQGGNSEAAELYPERIRILPYGDHLAWKQALEALPDSFPSISPEPFATVAGAYAKLLPS